MLMILGGAQCVTTGYNKHWLHCALAAAQCIVIDPVSLSVFAECVCVCLWICYYDNSKLRASILTKLGL